MSAKKNSTKVKGSNAELAGTPKNVVSLPKEKTDSKEEVPLNEAEQQLFENSEKMIQSGLSSFIEVGKALKAIKTQRLHREKYEMPFEAYCEERWGMSRQQADRLIDASDCWLKLQKELPKGTYLPINEAQVRPLVPMGEGKWVEAWQKVLAQTNGEKVTAQKVKDIVGVKPAPNGAAEPDDEPGDESDDESGDEQDADETCTDTLTKQKLIKVAYLVATALKEQEPTVANLKKVLEDIQKVLE